MLHKRFFKRIDNRLFVLITQRLFQYCAIVVRKIKLLLIIVCNVWFLLGFW